MKLIIQIPCLNEADTLPSTLRDLPRAIAQLVSLERRTARGGRDSIDHAPGTHDDLANAIAGLVVRAGGKQKYDSSLAWV